MQCFETRCNFLLSYAKKAEELKAVSLASAMETVEKLEVKLADFAKKHKHEIQHDPAFRAKFLDMCAPLGRQPKWFGFSPFCRELLFI